MKRILGFTTAGIVVALLAIFAVACGGSDSSNSSNSGASALSSGAANKPLVKVRWGTPNNTANAVPTGIDGYGVKTGVFNKVLNQYGFDLVSYAPFPNGPPLIDALQSGSIDLAAVGEAPAINSKANGIDTVAIMQSGYTNDLWVFGKKNGPTTFDELKGKNVGVAFGSNADYYIRAVLKEKGLTNSVKLLNIAATDAPAALQKGDLDANVFFVGADTANFLAQGYQLIDKASQSHPDLQSTSIVLVKSDFFKQNPTLADAWYKAHQASLDAARKNPDDYYAWQASIARIPVDYEKQVDNVNDQRVYPNEPFPQAPFKSLQDAKQYLLDAGLAKKDFSLDAWFGPAKSAKGAGQ